MKEKSEIILLHGLGRDRRIMQPMQNFLSDQPACVVHNISYPSMRHDFPDLVSIIRTEIQNSISKDSTIHFIGHSMGGILVRLILQSWRPERLGRVVQVGSPNQGTELVDFLNQTGLFRVLYGVAASRLGTDPDSIIHELKPVDYELGVVAANRTSLADCFFSTFVFNRDNDGLVPVDSTKVINMKDFVLVPATHMAVIYDKRTLKQVKHFLETGSFVAS